MPEVTRITRPVAWRQEFIRLHDYRCHYCNRFAGSVDVGPEGKPWHVDHKVALANGGADAEDNLALACERCNLIKHTLPYQNFREIARGAFWEGEPRRLVARDLEELTTSFLRSTDGEWSIRINENYEGPAYVIRSHEQHELDDSADEVIVTGPEGQGADMNGYFIVLAHRLMPKLIAEIHLLRAELAATEQTRGHRAA